MHRRQSGTIVVYALIVLAVGAVVLAGWVQLLATRSENVEIKAFEVQRRLTLDNSRLWASQYLLDRVFTGTFAQVSNSTNWGRFVIPASATIALDSATLAAAGGTTNTINHFSPASYDGYTVDLSAAIFDGTTNSSGVANSATYRFRARSRSPMLGYDLFTQQNPASTFVVSGDVIVSNNVMLWNPGLGSYSFLSGSGRTYTASTTNATAPTALGFALSPMTSWNTNFSGSSSTLNPAVTVNSMVVRGGTGVSVNPAIAATNSPTGVTVTTNATNRAVTINLATVTTNKISLQQGTTNFGLNISGYSGATNLTSVVLIATNASNLTNITLVGSSNTRRFYLGVRNRSTGLTLSGTGSWRLGGVFEITPLTITASGLQITGGLRADRSVAVSSGTLTIVRETDPGTLESQTDRVGWLEVYRQ